jgi:hypothetical protein
MKKKTGPRKSAPISIMIKIQKNTANRLIVHKNDLTIQGFGLIEIRPFTLANSAFLAAVDSEEFESYFDFQLIETSAAVAMDGEFEMQQGIGNVWIFIYDELAQTLTPTTEPIYKELGKI